MIRAHLSVSLIYHLLFAEAFKHNDRVTSFKP